MMNIRKIKIVIAVFLSVQLVAWTGAPLTVLAESGNTGYNPLGGPPYPFHQDSYFTDDYGNILMYINVIGSVGRQGQFIVREDVDFSTVIALIGGVSPEANLRKVLVIRSEPDDNGKQAYVVDLKPFIKKGDCSNFIALKPGDTIIVPDKALSLRKIAQFVSLTYPVISLYNLLDNN